MMGMHMSKGEYAIRVFGGVVRVDAWGAWGVDETLAYVHDLKHRIDTMQRGLAEGFEFLQMGRALLREPDLLAKMQAGQREEGLCVHCNKCMPTIYAGTHCVLVSPTERPGAGRVTAPIAD